MKKYILASLIVFLFLVQINYVNSAECPIGFDRYTFSKFDINNPTENLRFIISEAKNEGKGLNEIILYLDINDKTYKLDFPHEIKTQNYELSLERYYWEGEEYVYDFCIKDLHEESNLKEDTIFDDNQQRILSAKGETIYCMDGVWKLAITSKKPYCRNPEHNLYIDERGAEHCQPSSYPSVNDGTWCSLKTDNCNNINLDISNVCLDKKQKLLEFTLKNKGPTINELGYRIDQNSDYREGIFGIEFESGKKERFSISVEYINSKLINFNEYLEILIIPLNPYLCRDKVISIYDYEIKDCNTGEILNKGKSEIKLPTGFFKIFGIIIGSIGGLVALFFLFKFYKKYSKKEKKPRKIKKIEIEEKEISKIPSNITTAIEVNNFSVKKGSKSILKNVNFKIKRGDFTSIIGPAGSGKSTIIECLMGRKKPTAGTAKIFAKSINTKGIYDNVGFVPQNPEVYRNQTVYHNIKNSAIKWGVKNADKKIENILDRLNLSNRKNTKAGNLSGGQTRLLSLAMELIRNPELLVLDEPTTGLDPNTRNEIITILSSLVSYSHKTVLITTHFMDDAEECDDVVIIGNQKILVQGSPQKLEKRLPGAGKVVNIILDNVTTQLLNKIEKIPGVKKVIREGRSLNILTKETSPVKLGNKISELGGVVNEAKVSRATMKEVFVYYTGEKPEE